MATRQAKRVYREMTPEEETRWLQACKEAEAEKEWILAEGRRIKAAHQRARSDSNP